MKIIISEKNDLQILQHRINEHQNRRKIWPGEINRISPTQILIKNPIHSREALFFHANPRYVNISSNIAELPGFSSSNIDYSFALKSITKDDEYEYDTLWIGIKCIPPGSFLKINAQFGSLRFEISENIEFELHSIACDFDPMEILSREIKQRAEIDNASSINISFSGGCDSLGLLAAARSIGSYPVTAVTWTYDGGSAHEDLVAARDFTSALDIRHLIVDIDPAHIFAPLDKNELTPNVSTSGAFHRFKKIFNSYILEEIGPDTLMLNGHGGDHLYMEPVPIEVIFDVYRQFGWRSAGLTLRNLTFLYGENYFRLLNKFIRQRKNKIAQLKFFFNQKEFEKYTWKNTKEKNKTAKQIHKERIRQAIYQNSTSSVDRRLLLATPFTSPSIIASVWNKHPIEFFDHQKTRIPFKNSMRSFDESKLLRKSIKGHITGAFQQALKTKKHEISQMVTDGLLNSRRILNTTNVLNGIDASAQGYGGLNPILLKIICFELMMNAIK